MIYTVAITVSIDSPGEPRFPSCHIRQEGLEPPCVRRLREVHTGAVNAAHTELRHLRFEEIELTGEVAQSLRMNVTFMLTR